MKDLFITQVGLKTLVKNLKRECDEFIAPKIENLDDIVFGDAKDDDRELLAYNGNSVISPRAFLLPQTENLFEIKSAKDCDFLPIKDGKKRVFYGVRPCDIKALILMRKFFTDEFVDLPYKERLEDSIFIALSCNKRCSEKSFCYEMDSGPRAKDGFDLQLSKINLGYIVEIGSKKGSQIIKNNKKLFTDAKPEHEREIKNTLKDFTKGIKQIDYKKLARIMKQEKIKESVWDDIGLRCVICSGCITLCPTCSCFSIADRLNGDKGIRMRYCDGCPYAGFTRMAGGGAPFPKHKDHIRRFFEHKLNIDVERYGTPSCVGCGRCIQTCPGNINIKKFIDNAMDARVI